MNLLDTLLRWWNCTLRFDRGKRLIFYRMMRAQLSAGLPLSKALENLTESLYVYPEAAIAARRALQTLRTGDGAAKGFRDSRLVPLSDVGVIRVAERRGNWLPALDTLFGEIQQPQTFFVSVISPNAYFLIVLGVALILAFLMQGILLEITTDPQTLRQNPAYQLSVWLDQWLLPLLAASGAYTMLVLWGRPRWQGSGRYLLLPFDREYRLRVALRYSRFASLMHRQGAGHVDVLNDAMELFAAEPYVLRQLRDARNAHTGGLAIERALAGRVLNPQHAGLLQNMAPQRLTTSYPAAYAALTELLQALLAKRHQSLLVATRILALIGFVVLFLTMAGGIFTMFTDSVFFPTHL